MRTPGHSGTEVLQGEPEAVGARTEVQRVPERACRPCEEEVVRERSAANTMQSESSASVPGM